MIPPRIYLTGFMGSGKSTCGPLLAERLGYRFLDLDAEVERIAGISISEVFEQRGEAKFRALETAVLSEAATQENVIVATGGGALATEGNLLLAETSGAIAFLKLPATTLAARLHNADGRPLLHDEHGEPYTEAALTARIEELLARRERFYSQADIVVEADHMTPEDVAGSIVQALSVVAAG